MLGIEEPKRVGKRLEGRFYTRKLTSKYDMISIDYDSTWLTIDSSNA